jgi:hypothetical protein
VAAGLRLVGQQCQGAPKVGQYRPDSRDALSRCSPYESQFDKLTTTLSVAVAMHVSDERTTPPSVVPGCKSRRNVYIPEVQSPRIGIDPQFTHRSHSARS